MSGFWPLNRKDQQPLKTPAVSHQDGQRTECIRGAEGAGSGFPGDNRTVGRSNCCLQLSSRWL